MDAARTRFDRTRPERVNPGFLLYVLLDELVDGYFDATDRVENTLEDLEDRIFAEEFVDEREVQQELFDLRRRLLVFRRAVVPLREVVSALIRREVQWVDDATATICRTRTTTYCGPSTSSNSQRELMGNAVDAHLAIISNRMNSVMKKMTSWGATASSSSGKTTKIPNDHNHGSSHAWQADERSSCRASHRDRQWPTAHHAGHRG